MARITSSGMRIKSSGTRGKSSGMRKLGKMGRIAKQQSKETQQIQKELTPDEKEKLQKEFEQKSKEDYIKGENAKLDNIIKEEQDYIKRTNQKIQDSLKKYGGKGSDNRGDINNWENDITFANKQIQGWNKNRSKIAEGYSYATVTSLAEQQRYQKKRDDANKKYQAQLKEANLWNLNKKYELENLKEAEKMFKWEGYSKADTKKLLEHVKNTGNIPKTINLQTEILSGLHTGFNPKTGHIISTKIGEGYNSEYVPVPDSYFSSAKLIKPQDETITKSIYTDSSGQGMSYTKPSIDWKNLGKQQLKDYQKLLN